MERTIKGQKAVLTILGHEGTPFRFSINDKLHMELTHVEELKKGSLYYVRYYEAYIVVSDIVDKKVVRQFKIHVRMSPSFFREWHKGFAPSKEAKTFLLDAWQAARQTSNSLSSCC
jgi:hypothetical protein